MPADAGRKGKQLKMEGERRELESVRVIAVLYTPQMAEELAIFYMRYRDRRIVLLYYHIIICTTIWLYCVECPR